MKKANLLIDCQDHLGEGVLWSKTDQKLYWLDVPMPSKLHQLHIPTNNHDTFDMPEMITAMSVRPSGDLLIASHHGINNFNFENKPKSLKLFYSYLGPFLGNEFSTS